MDWHGRLQRCGIHAILPEKTLFMREHNSFRVQLDIDIANKRQSCGFSALFVRFLWPDSRRFAEWLGALDGLDLMVVTTS